MKGHVLARGRRGTGYARVALVAMLIASLFVIAPPADAADVFSVAFKDASNSQVEGDSGQVGVPVTVVLSTTAPLEADATVDVVVSGGSATSGSDYSFTSPTQVTFPATSVQGAEQSVSVLVNGDTTVEPDQDVVLGLTNASAGGTPDAGTHTLTITNDDADVFSVAFKDASNSQVEGDSGQVGVPVTVVLSTTDPLSADATVDVVVSGGSATSGSDYSFTSPTQVTFPATSVQGAEQSVSVLVNGDTTVEPDQDVVLGLTNASAGGTPDAGTHTLTITNDDADVFTVAFAAPSSAPVEGDSGQVGVPVTVVLSTTDPLSADATVDVVVSGGSATSGVDYTGPTPVPVTFPGGSADGATQDATIVVNGDITAEPDETVALGFGAISAGGTPGGQTTHTLTITNDDIATLSISDADQIEEGLVSAFTITLSTPSSAPVTVSYATADGTAEAGPPGNDYTAIALTPVTFTPGQTTKTVNVTTLEDTLDEANETFTLNLSASSGPVITDASGIGTIVDDDGPPGLSVLDAAVVSEGPGTVQLKFTVALLPMSGQIVTADYATANGTAVAPGDYVPKVGTVTFDPGDTLKDVLVTVTNDALDEIDETVLLNLTGWTNTGIPADAQAVGTIEDDDNQAPKIDKFLITDGSGTPRTTFALGETTMVNVEFSDPGLMDTHEVRVSWEDATPDFYQVIPGAGVATRTVAATHAYQIAAQHTITVIITDEEGAFVRQDAIPIIVEGSSTLDTVGLFDPNKGLWHLRNAIGDVKSLYFGNPGDYPFVGDWDCNGTETPGLYRQADGFVYLRNSNTAGIADIRFYFGNPGDIPIAGDFNGNGCDTVSIYRPSEGRVYIINALGANDGGLGAAEVNYYFGNPGDKPFVGDFNRNGIETVGLHRESTGFVYFRNSHTQGIADSQFYFGDPGDRLVAGDWTRDAMDTPALFRPSNTTMYFRHTNTQGNADDQFVWGESTWLPVAGYFGL